MCSLGWQAGRMCAWMGAQLHGSRATRAGAGEVLALTIIERIFSDWKIHWIRPCCAAFRHALEEPGEPPDVLGPSPPIPPTTSEV